MNPRFNVLLFVPSSAPCAPVRIVKMQRPPHTRLCFRGAAARCARSCSRFRSRCDPVDSRSLLLGGFSGFFQILGFHWERRRRRNRPDALSRGFCCTLDSVWDSPSSQDSAGRLLSMRTLLSNWPTLLLQVLFSARLRMSSSVRQRASCSTRTVPEGVEGPAAVCAWNLLHGLLFARWSSLWSLSSVSLSGTRSRCCPFSL